MVGGWYIYHHDEQEDLIYEIIATFEESLEMIGLVIFSYALMMYIEKVQNIVAIQIGQTRPGGVPEGQSSRRVAEKANG